MEAVKGDWWSLKFGPLEEHDPKYQLVGADEQSPVATFVLYVSEEAAQTAAAYHADELGIECEPVRLVSGDAE